MFYFFWCCPIMCLRSVFRVVMCVKIRCSVRHFLRLLVGGRMDCIFHKLSASFLCNAFACQAIVNLNMNKAQTPL